METMQGQLKKLESRLYHREEEVIGLGERLQKRADLQDVKAVPVYEAYKTMGLINEDQILGILGQFVCKNHEWIDREFFWKKYGEINQKLNPLLSLLGSPNNRKETICQAEKVIADLMVILRYHWGTRADSLGRICNFISICKYSEYLSIIALENMPPSGPAIFNRGFNPSSSLIPSATGPAIFNRGFDPSSSVIPSASGPAICNRGFDPSSSHIPSASGPAIFNRAFDPFALRSDSLVKEDLMTERMDHILDQLGFLLKEEEVLQEMHLICDERERLYGISRKLFLG